MTIKRRPSDFKVDEVLTERGRDAIRHEPAAFALYRLRKQSLTTPEAMAMVARKLGVAVGTLAHAGLKDRHAATMQHFSALNSQSGRRLPQRASGHNWSIERIGWLDEELSSEAIAGNHFEIMVRGLSRRVANRMDEAATALGIENVESGARPRTLGIVNYFGAQRFGSARHGQGFAAKHLIKGDFETGLQLLIATPSRKERSADNQLKRKLAEQWGRWSDLLAKPPRWPERAVIEHLASSPEDFRGAFAKLPYFTQQIAVEAYQSHLWNQIARELVLRKCQGPGRVFRVDDPFGEMNFPAAVNIGHDLADLMLPLLGRNSQLSEPWRHEAELTLAREGISAMDLRIPGLKRPFFGEAPRRLFIEATNFTMGIPQNDEGDQSGQRFRSHLEMDLPRGAYATVVLRALGQ